MKTRLVVGLALLAASAMGTRTLNWQGTGSSSPKYWSDSGNWKDAVGGTNAVPQSGDILYLTATGYPSKNDITDLELQQLKLASPYQYQHNTSKALIFRAGSDGIDNAGFLFFDIPVFIEGTNMTVKSTSTFVPRNNWKSYDGNPCGVVKTGSGTAGIGSGTDYTGFKYVEVRAGKWAYGVNGLDGSKYLPPGQVFTFAAADTYMQIGTDCVFTNFWLREIGAAVGGKHYIGSAYNNTYYSGRLTIAGTPPDDETVFTGAFVDRVDFRWMPDSSAKTFVLDGKTSTTTGNVEVANGTMRLVNGASFSQIGELKLSGGSVLKVEAVPATAFRAQTLSLMTTSEKMHLAANVTLTFTRAIRNGLRLAAGTYTKANADWIEGDGSVVVEGASGYTLKWVTNVTPRNWSNANCWINQSSGLNDTPADGDTLICTTTTANNDSNQARNNDIDNLKLYKLSLAGSGLYQVTYGKEITFLAGSYGIESEGYLFHALPTRLQGTDIILDVYGNTGHYTGFTKSLQSVDGNPCGFVKKGTGVFGIRPEQGQYWTGFKYIRLEGGTVALGAQRSGELSMLDPGLEITFAAKSTTVTVEKDVTMPGLCLIETGAAVNDVHKISSRNSDNTIYSGTLTITGSPRLDRQTFTGSVEGSVALAWSPDTADKMLVFSGANSISTTTNALTVTRGTVRLTGGASFTRLRTLTLSGGAGTTFEVEMPPSVPFHATNLVLATGSEQLHIGSGVKMAVDTLSIDGVEQPAGVYRATANIFVDGTTAASWIDGAGFLCVGGADVQLPGGAEGSTSGTWTANGGADTSIGNPANWGEADNIVLPDLTNGTLTAAFSAGSAAALDRFASFKGLVLDTPGAWSFTSSGYAATLGANGVETSGAGRTYAFGWPLWLATPQTWTIGTGDTVNVNASFTGNERLTVEGGGTLNLNVTPLFDGELVLSNRVVNVNADDAMGANSSLPVKIDMAVSTLYLNGGVTVNRTIENIAPDADSRTGNLYVTGDGKTNIVEGALEWSAYNAANINVAPNSTLRVKGRFHRGRSYWCDIKGGSAAGRGTVIFDGPMVVDGGAAVGILANMSIWFNAPDNDLGSNWMWFNHGNSEIHTTVPYAFTTAARHCLRSQSPSNGRRVWDMHGCDQGLSQLLGCSALEITSATPATLHLNVTAANLVNTNDCKFTGGAGISFEGTQFTRLSGESTSTGIVQVTKGRLEMAPTGKWPNATRVVVTGGTLKLEGAEAFGQATEMDISGGTVALDFSGTLRMGSLAVGGEPMNPGIYGAADNASVPARNRLSCLTGTGRLLFGDGLGTVLLLR